MTTENKITARDFIEAILKTLRSQFADLAIQISAGDLIDEMTGEVASELTAPWLRVYVIPVRVDTQVRYRPGSVPVVYAVQVQCCLSTKTANFQTELSEFASNVMTIVAAWDSPGRRVNAGKLQMGQRWGLETAIEPPLLITSYPGALNSLPHGHDAIIVAWEQTIYRPERITANDQLDY